MAAGKIVVVEDDGPIRQGIVATLRAGGYEPIETADGEAGLQAALRPGVDLVLLDLMLPRLDGAVVLKRLRQFNATLPVIILTARSSEDDRVAGLVGGADDYVVKPFSARELLARVEAVLRRSPERPQTVHRLRVGRAVVDLARREVRVAKDVLQSLSETECALLSHLAANSGRAVSREELLTRVWGVGGSGIETRTIDMHVARLRSKLAACDPEAESAIVTVRGKGYMLAADVCSEADA